MRDWLVTLIREAVRAEVAQHFRVLEDKAALTEAALSSVSVRAKQEQKPQRPRTWQEAREKLEAKSEISN